jgi:CubicO group peptidase (beta-lactamase class C family)
MHYARNRNLSAEVESLARPLVEKGETPGIVVGVLLPDGSSSMYGYGVTDRQSGRKPDGDTLFAIGSLSKGFLGAITALLVQDGTLSWSDTLETLLPPDTPLSADAKKITLIQLATHTSGLPNQPKNFQIFRYFVEYLFTGKSFYRHLNEAYVLKSLSDFKAPRHAQVLYSSLGYAMLGYAIEKRTGLSLDALLEQKLTQPLGLRNTGYEPRSLPGYSTRAYGYAGDHPFFIRRGRPVPDWEFTEFMKGAGGVYSTANDLLTFAAAHLQDPKTALGRGLSDTLQVRVPRPEESPAVAWFVDDIEGQRITYQVGVVAGYTSYLGLDVERRIAVVVLENSFNRTNKVGHKLLMRLGRALPKAAEIK